MPLTADVCVIGSGPGGYVCAIRASRLGLKTVVVEQGDLGGVCTNTGCIPTKALLRSAEVYHLASSAKTYGVRVDGVTADLPAIARRKDRVVSTLSRGIGALLASAGVEVVAGRGRLVSPGVVEVDLNAGGPELVTARNVVISTGSSPAVPPVPGFDLAGVMTSDDALELQEVPGSMVIVGGGAVGVEWASFFSALGCKVTLVEMLERLVARRGRGNLGRAETRVHQTEDRRQDIDRRKDDWRFARGVFGNGYWFRRRRGDRGRSHSQCHRSKRQHEGRGPGDCWSQVRQGGHRGRRAYADQRRGRLRHRRRDGKEAAGTSGLAPGHRSGRKHGRK